MTGVQTCALPILQVQCGLFNDTATTEIYTGEDTLSLHDALPIWMAVQANGMRYFPRHKKFSLRDNIPLRCWDSYIHVVYDSVLSKHWAGAVLTAW